MLLSAMHVAQAVTISAEKALEDMDAVHIADSGNAGALCDLRSRRRVMIEQALRLLQAADDLRRRTA